MSIKNLIVAYNGGEASLSALKYAVALAKSGDAHLTGILAHGMSHVARNIPNWMPIDLRSSIMTTLEKRATFIREGFERVIAKEIPSDRLHWIEIGGDPDTTISDYSRMYDVTIVGQYENLVEADELELHPAKIVASSGKPVIVVPKGYQNDSVGRRIVIAWDGWRAITTTVGDGIGILKNADEVTVVTVKSNKIGTALKGIDVDVMLARHGVQAKTIQIPTSTGSIGKDLLKFCSEHRADLLFMGAFSHSWISRQMGGRITENILENTDVPILMSH